METVLSNMNPMKVLFFLCKSATCFVMEEFYVGVGAGCKVAHSFSFLSFFLFQDVWVILSLL